MSFFLFLTFPSFLFLLPVSVPVPTLLLFHILSLQSRPTFTCTYLCCVVFIYVIFILLFPFLSLPGCLFLYTQTYSLSIYVYLCCPTLPAPSLLKLYIVFICILISFSSLLLSFPLSFSLVNTRSQPLFTVYLCNLNPAPPALRLPSTPAYLTWFSPLSGLSTLLPLLT